MELAGPRATWRGRPWGHLPRQASGLEGRVEQVVGERVRAQARGDLPPESGNDAEGPDVAEGVQEESAALAGRLGPSPRGGPGEW